jgi:hypothetical protein
VGQFRVSKSEVFVPQNYDWGQEGQVDWFEAVAKLGGESCKLQFFAMQWHRGAQPRTVPGRHGARTNLRPTRRTNRNYRCKLQRQIGPAWYRNVWVRRIPGYDA